MNFLLLQTIRHNLIEIVSQLDVKCPCPPPPPLISLIKPVQTLHMLISLTHLLNNVYKFKLEKHRCHKLRIKFNSLFCWKFIIRPLEGERGFIITRRKRGFIITQRKNEIIIYYLFHSSMLNDPAGSASRGSCFLAGTKIY